MAHGIVCRHCGHVEGTHDLFLKTLEVGGKKQVEKFFSDNEISNEKLPRYTMTLEECPGYSPEDPEEEKRLNELRKPTHRGPFFYD